MPEWEGPRHDAEHDRIARVLLQHARALQATRLTRPERQAVASAAAKMVADEALIENRKRRAPIWRDRRALAGWAAQITIAIVVLLTWLHSLNPGLP